jgi:hypothetical protein
MASPRLDVEVMDSFWLVSCLVQSFLRVGTPKTRSDTATAGTVRTASWRTRSRPTVRTSQENSIDFFEFFFFSFFFFFWLLGAVNNYGSFYARHVFPRRHRQDCKLSRK